MKFFNLKPSTSARVSKLANQFWLSGILFSITFSLLKVCLTCNVLTSYSERESQAGRLANEAKQLQGSTWSEKGAQVDRDVKLQANMAYVYYLLSVMVTDIYCGSVRADTRYQFIIDLLDIWIPATNLGLVNLNDGVVGIFGYVHIPVPSSTGP